MEKIIIGFLYIIGLYHIINTFAVRKLGINKEILVIIRDGSLIIFSLFLALNFNKTKTFIKENKNLLIIFLLYTIWGIIISLINNKSLKEIIIGIKYEVLPLGILLIGIFIGYFIDKNKFLNYFYNFLKIFLFLNIVIGIIKIIFPSIFIYLGYGLNDQFSHLKNPPVYYTTGLNGFPRLSGLFGGPNELGFFLIFIFPMFIYIYKKSKTLNIKAYHWLFIIFIGILTFSRSFILSTLIQFLIIYKKTRYFFVIGILGILSIIILSNIKGLSTLDHISLKFQGINKFKENKLGYGLGEVGPGVYYIKKEEKLSTIKKSIPENTYLEILINTGIIGFILFIYFWYLFLKRLFSDKTSIYGQIKRNIGYGIIGLGIAGLFLHIFGDSMVVYLTIFIAGILS